MKILENCTVKSRDKREQTKRSEPYQRIRHSGFVEREQIKNFTNGGVHNIRAKLNHLVRYNQIIKRKFEKNK